METLEAKLKRLLETGLSSAEAHLETLPNGHVCGDIVSPDFHDLDFDARRQRLRSIWDAARQENQLTDAELLQISTLLTYTPEEWVVDLKEF